MCKPFVGFLCRMKSALRQEYAVCRERIFSAPPPNSKTFNVFGPRQETNVNSV